MNETANTPANLRFAPSPTGRLHIGNIRTALYNWIEARRSGGRFLLRLDDTDRERSTQEFADGIVEDLEWLGIAPDAVFRQSDHLEAYDTIAEHLRKEGSLYPCYETPDEIERRRKRSMARGLPPIYDRAALRLSTEDREKLEDQGRKPHWRFLLPNFKESPFETRRTEVHWNDGMRGEQTVDLASMSDPVLIREDGSYLYTLPSVVDDMDMGVTHVVRGGDHITNTGAQIALFKAIGAKTIPDFSHHNLLVAADGEGLSKRSGALSIQSLREAGLEPMAINSLASLIGTGQSVLPVDHLHELAKMFDPSSVSRSPAKFSRDELQALNEKIVHAMPYDMARPRLEALKADGGKEFWRIVRANLAKLEDACEWYVIVFGAPEFESDPQEADFLAEAATCLPAAPWGDDVWKVWTNAVKERTGRKGRGLFMPLRKALTGREHGPDMGDLLTLIGREETSRRLPGPAAS